jgi:hypothetical protein
MNPAGPGKTPRGPNAPPTFLGEVELAPPRTTGGPTGPPESPPAASGFVQYKEGDFPDAAELPVPNVSPLTAHVLSRFRMADF